jgi:hypothetical protein
MPVDTIIFLDVPAADFDEVKALGAGFNRALGRWYVRFGRDAAPFSKWLPRQTVNKVNISTRRILTLKK